MTVPALHAPGTTRERQTLPPVAAAAAASVALYLLQGAPYMLWNLLGWVLDVTSGDQVHTLAQRWQDAGAPWFTSTSTVVPVVAFFVVLAAALGLRRRPTVRWCVLVVVGATLAYLVSGVAWTVQHLHGTIDDMAFSLMVSIGLLGNPWVALALATWCATHVRRRSTRWPAPVTGHGAAPAESHADAQSPAPARDAAPAQDAASAFALSEPGAPPVIDRSLPEADQVK